VVAGKLCILIFSAWGGANSGGIIAGLAVCTIIQTIVGMCSDLMQDFKTGYLVPPSPLRANVLPAKLRGKIVVTGTVGTNPLPRPGSHKCDCVVEK